MPVRRVAGQGGVGCAGEADLGRIAHMLGTAIRSGTQMGTFLDKTHCHSAQGAGPNMWHSARWRSQGRLQLLPASTRQGRATPDLPPCPPPQQQAPCPPASRPPAMPRPPRGGWARPSRPRCALWLSAKPAAQSCLTGRGSAPTRQPSPGPRWTGSRLPHRAQQGEQALRGSALEGSAEHKAQAARERERMRGCPVLQCCTIN